jgi:hypothetical protein
VIDIQANYGVLYAKIKVKEDHYIHVFNTHAQSTEGVTEEDLTFSYDSRHDNIQQVRDFIVEKTEGISKNDLILVAGDFNVDCLPLNDKSSGYDQYMPEGSELRTKYHGACQRMEDQLSGSGKITNALKESHGDYQITIGDSFINP